MKKQWTLLIMILFVTLAVFVGCKKREATKEEIYSDFQKEISKIESYSCIAEIEVTGNKTSKDYVVEHYYKKPDYYKLKVISPKHLEGKTMEYKNNKIFIKNPEIGDTVELPNEGNDNQYLFIGDFMKNYLQNEDVKINVSKENLVLETSIPGEDKYFSKQRMYINTKTKNPEKMEIIDKDGKIRFNVIYKDFNYKK